MRIVAIERHRGKYDICRGLTSDIEHCQKRVRRKPLIGAHCDNVSPARSGKTLAKASSARRIVNVYQIDVNISARGNIERMTNARRSVATCNDNLHIVEVLVLDAFECTHRVAGRTLHNKDHRKSRKRATSKQVIHPLDSNNQLPFMVHPGNKRNESPDALHAKNRCCTRLAHTSSILRWLSLLPYSSATSSVGS